VVVNVLVELALQLFDKLSTTSRPMWTLHWFAREHERVTDDESGDPIREDWPLGPVLRRRREEAGLSQREASRRTRLHGSDRPTVSAGRWQQLETGWQKNKGTLIPIGTTAATVSAAARAVGWDARQALELAGFDAEEPSPPPVPTLFGCSDEELAAEVLRRMRRTD
jgi:transcriptional regulator with XRE-family HTH domain